MSGYVDAVMELCGKGLSVQEALKTIKSEIKKEIVEKKIDELEKNKKRISHPN